MVLGPRNGLTLRAVTYGYCGETSVQTFELYHGAWLSLRTIRKAGKGALRIHRPDEKSGRTFERALLHLNIDHEFCTADDPDTFRHWLQEQLTRCDGPDRRRRLVALGVMLPTGRDPEYDHIVTVVDFQADHFCVHDHMAAAATFVHQTDLVQPDRRSWLASPSHTSFAIPNGHFFAIGMIRFRGIQGRSVPAVMIGAITWVLVPKPSVAELRDDGWKVSDTETQHRRGPPLQLTFYLSKAGRFLRLDEDGVAERQGKHTKYSEGAIVTDELGSSRTSARWICGA